MTTAARRTLDAAFTLLVVLVVILVVALKLVPAVTGLTPLTILTGSMTPDLPPGTLIYIDRETMPEPGQVATYLTATTPITHRVVETRNDFTGNDTEYIFRGDANLTDDPKAVPSGAVLGVMTVSVPALGFPAYILSRPIGIALTISLGLLLIGVRTLIPNKETAT